MLKREKIIKYKKALFENTVSASNIYKFIRNIYKVKTEYKLNKFTSNTSNQKKSWHKITELIIKIPRNVIKSVIFNKIEYNINSEMDENVGTYYVNK